MLTLEIVPYHQIESLTSVGRIRKLLNIAKENKIVLLQGRLSKDEETELIKATMEEIDDVFKGIELAVIDPEKGITGGLSKLRESVASMLLGDRGGLTVIGPATVIKEIRKDPTKIQLLTKEYQKRDLKKQKGAVKKGKKRR